jgi:type IV pilus assembly protein PilF
MQISALSRGLMVRYTSWLRGGLAVFMAMSLAACDTPGKSASTDSAGNPTRDREIRDETAGAPKVADARTRAAIRTELALNYFQRGQMAIALEEARTAMRDDPTFAPAWNVMGLIQMDLRDNAQADSAFQRALRLAPADPDINNNFGWFLCQSGKPQQSIAYFLKAVADPLYNAPWRSYMNAGICSLRANDTAGAEAHFLRSFQLDPGNSYVMAQLGLLYYKRGDMPRAQFYSDRLNQDVEASADGAWLGLLLARRKGDQLSEQSFATQLRRRFPESEPARKLSQGQYE